MVRKSNGTLRSAFFVSVFTATLGGGTAWAEPISPGFDLFSSNDEFGNSLGSAVDLSALGLGIVDLKGVPFSFGPFGPGTGIDTIVERKQGIDPFDWPGGVGTIDIELVALHLVSIDPIDLTPLGGPFVGLFADLHTTINAGGIIPGLPQPDALPPSLGRMEIRHEDPDGGTFDSVFGAPGDPVPPALSGLLVPGGGVTANAIFTAVGGNPADPGEVFFSTLANRLPIWSLDSGWEHNSFTDFQVTSIEHFCPFPDCHPVRPVPQPGSIALLGTAGLAACRRRRG